MSTVEPHAASGLLAALRAMGATLAEAAGVRGQLLALELGEEVERRKRLLVLAVVAAACFHFALLLVTFAVVAAFWETHRITAIVVMAGAYLGVGGAAFYAFRSQSSNAPQPFAATRGEIERDLEALRAP